MQFDTITISIVFFLHIGAKKEGNEIIYIRAEQRISFATKIFIYSSIMTPTSTLAPFILAAYHWFLGKYTINSWILFFPAW